MGKKEEVSSEYINSLKALHGHKVLRTSRNAIITGDEFHNSIGACIRDNAPSNISFTSFKGDATCYDGYGKELFSNADTLIICHGITNLAWLEDEGPLMMAKIVETNLTSIMVMTSRFVQETINEPYKKQIFIIGSMASKAVLNGSAAYCASKAGLAHFSKCIAWELAPKGYDVFLINPSNTEGTPMTEATIRGLMNYRNLTFEEAYDYWSANLPKSRWLQPWDISNLINFLLSGHGEYLSGSALDMAGGQR